MGGSERVVCASCRAAKPASQPPGNSGELDAQGDERAQEIERLLNDVLIAGAFGAVNERRAAKKAALDYILAALAAATPEGEQHGE